KGPNIVGPYGLLQPTGDTVKLFIKEALRIYSSPSTICIFIIAPILALTLALTI
ncbi:hypothetical protein DBR06_SOUSAS2710041, partial [Sousa chinensis]